MPAKSGSRVQLAVLLAIIVVVACLLGYGYYLQFVEYLDPCPLCLTQRFFYYLAAIFTVLAIFALRKLVWQKVMAGLIFLSGVGGLATAGRQVWLQHLPPDKVPECGPGLQYWLDNNPLSETLALLFKGDGNCAEVVWSFLGGSIALWSFVFFLLMTLTALWLFACGRRLET